ncbi:MAG: hypothetical protein HC906_08100 [Bacteroidales bacterium]|nr:hypothetical protein [Bacteroidales bacterium]
MGTRTDTLIDFAWDYNDKGFPSMQEELFCIRWNGFLCPKESGAYRLSISSDDGSRLYLNGKQIVENWGIQGMRVKSAIVELEANKKYPLQIDYFENTGWAGIKFEWEKNFFTGTHERCS